MLAYSTINIYTDDGDTGKDFIKTMFKMIFGEGSGDSDSLVNKLSGYDEITNPNWMLSSGNVMGVIADLMNTVFSPAVIAFLTVIFTINFFKTLISLDGNDSSGGVQKIIQIAIKYALLVILAKNAIMIVQAIAAVVDRLVSKAGNNVYHPTSAGYEKVKDAVDGLGTIDSIILIIVLLIPFLIAVAANVGIYVIVILRLAEFMMLGAAAPIPIAFLGDDDTKSIGIGYLKKLFAIGIQAILLLFIPKITRNLPLFNEDVFTNATSSTLVSITSSNFLALLVIPIITLVLAFSTGKISKAIMGE